MGCRTRRGTDTTRRSGCAIVRRPRSHKRLVIVYVWRQAVASELPDRRVYILVVLRKHYNMLLGGLVLQTVLPELPRLYWFTETEESALGDVLVQRRRRPLFSCPSRKSKQQRRF